MNILITDREVLKSGDFIVYDKGTVEFIEVRSKFDKNRNLVELDLGLDYSYFNAVSVKANYISEKEM